MTRVKDFFFYTDWCLNSEGNSERYSKKCEFQLPQVSEDEEIIKKTSPRTKTHCRRYFIDILDSINETLRNISVCYSFIFQENTP